MSVDDDTVPSLAARGPVLNGVTIYFAHPIDLAMLNEAQQRSMYDLMRALHNSGAVVYDPAGAFSVGLGARPNPIISQVNRAALLAADAIVACWPETPGVGTSMELQLADSIGMPALVMTAVATRSWSLAGLQHAMVVSSFERDRDLPWLYEEAAEYQAIRGRAPAPEPMPMFTLVDDPRFLPHRKHPDDAAFDLYVSEEVAIEPGAIVDVPAGCAVQFPNHVWGLILGRSSTSRSHRLLVHPGVIDTGYRGPLFVQIENIGTEPFKAEVGMRLGQLIPLPNLASQMAAMSSVMLTPSGRGDSGFGSTGA